MDFQQLRCYGRMCVNFLFGCKKLEFYAGKNTLPGVGETIPL